jgi:hypothetical protein
MKTYCYGNGYGIDAAMFRPSKLAVKRVAVAQRPVGTSLRRIICRREEKELKATEAGMIWLDELLMDKGSMFFVSCAAADSTTREAG